VPDLTDKDRLRIADVAKTPEERASLEKVCNLFTGMIEERNSAFSASLDGNVDKAVQEAFRKHAESKLPEANPKRMAVDAYSEVLRGLRSGARDPGFYGGIAEKFSSVFSGTREEVEAHVRATMTTASSGFSTTGVMPAPTANEVLGYAEEVIPLASIVRTWPSNTMTGYVPVETDAKPICYITSQASAPTDATYVPGVFSYSLLKFAVGVPFSNQLYDYNVPAFQVAINRAAAYGLRIKQWQQFGVGTNSTQWMGLESAGLTQVTALTSEKSDLIGALWIGVPQMHRPRAIWVCNETTLLDIWQLKDGDGRRLVPFDTEKMTLFGKQIYTNAALTDHLLFCGDMYYYVWSSGRFMSASIGFGNGFTMTSQDSMYIYIGHDCDGGVAMTNAIRYANLT
jgi:HK97 family phage major capsid protein